MGFLSRFIPHPLRVLPKRIEHNGVKRARLWAERWGLMVARRADYYSPLSSELDLRAHESRWNKPSALRGLRYDLPAMKTRLEEMLAKYGAEFAALPPFETLRTLGFGPGFARVDAFTLYAMIRELQPAHYLEVGSGLSTYYCHLARLKNRATGGRETKITCVEPFPYEKLRELEGIEIIAKPVQDVALERFTALAAGDVLFIDSSHAVRIDGDVPFLFLEVLPAVAAGLHIHVHDIPFPYNIPYPAEYWTLLRHRRSPRWPIYWNEAMLVQAFLAFNSSFELTLSCPLLRHHEEAFLKSRMPFYKPVSEEANTFSSLWMRRAD